MKYELGFDKEKISFSVADRNLSGVLQPNRVNVGLTGTAEVRRALANPIGSKRLKDLVRPDEKITIITSDITRPMPSKLVLPEVRAELAAAGVADSQITIVFALGSHRKHTVEEQKYLVGADIYAKIKCVDSDPADCVHLGATPSGTPVDIFRAVAEADRRICLGNIEYHYFAGYSGGAKAIMPGVSTRAAIQANHSKMVEAAAKAGALDDNPVRQDIEAVAQLTPIDFIVNVVLDEHKQIIKAVAGHYQEAHRAGCQFLDRFYKIKITQAADIVIVATGGYPKDINLYQAQKALDNAKHAVRPGGIIILAASCRDGLGEAVFERWMLDAATPQSMIDRIQSHFELGGHKAAAIAMVLQNAQIFLVSSLAVDFVRRLFMRPFATLDEALAQAFGELGPDAKVLLMPYGGSTLPVVAG
jgi:nickel-dependent lactate racemase